MRGQGSSTDGFFSYVPIEQRIPADHPLRTIKGYADTILKRLSPQLGALYSHTGKPSIPPERLLKAQLLMALFSVRSDRRFCADLPFNLLWLWFLDMDPDEAIFTHAVFTGNRERLLNHEVARQFFDEAVKLAREAGLLGDERFSVDGTLIEAWASHKSFRPVAPDDDDNDPDNFRGRKRSNRTHRSTTDGDARLLRKSDGQPARLSYVASALMDHRHGLLSDWLLDIGEDNPEHRAVEVFLMRNKRCRGMPMKSLAGDKGYHSRALVEHVRRYGVSPHFAARKDRRTPGLDRRTMRTASYRLSQRIRKTIEQSFGWLKTVGGLRRTRFRGRRRVEAHSLWAATSYNLMRMAGLAPACAA